VRRLITRTGRDNICRRVDVGKRHDGLIDDDRKHINQQMKGWQRKVAMALKDDYSGLNRAGRDGNRGKVWMWYRTRHLGNFVFLLQEMQATAGMIR
jgi:hypothetical protein